MPQDEIRELPEFMIPVLIRVRNHEEAMVIEPISVPVNWIDALAFNGDGFTVTVNLPREIHFPKGSTVQFQIGNVGRQSMEEPPFDPPYSSNVKRKDPPPPLYPGGPPEG